jgi:glycosyltransferase involved in cell wall biosynthesis
MRILHFYKNALPETIGGIEQTIDQIARGTQVLGVSNTVLALSNSPANFPVPLNGYELITVKRDFELASNGFSWQSLTVFKELAAKADLIHYHFPWPFMDLVHRWVSPKKPTVLTYHSDIIRQKLLLKLYRPFKQSFLRSVDHIVATSPNYLITSNVLKSFSEKTSVIPIGLDQESYPKPCPTKIEYYQELFGKRYFLFIGAFRYYKGLPFLIKAAEITPYPIVIVGSGPAAEELKALAARHQLNNVFFLGSVTEENKSALLASCFSIVFPSNLRSEAFGVSLLEGAMFGKPLISCEIGTGTTFINIDRLTGLVVPPSDSIALSNAMTWLWNHPEQAAEMGKKANSRYKELFTAKRMAQSYLELYHKLHKR